MNASPCAPMRPHDLLWPRVPLSSIGPAAVPAWVNENWPVVVRRAAPQREGLVPIGLRGRERHQRHATWLDRAQVGRSLAPEALARSACRETLRIGEPAPLEALRALAPFLDEIGLPWGPSGSVGFAVATGVALLRPDSDLDLLVRAAAAPTARQVDRLKALQGRTRCRLDIQIDTGNGGFALNEWLGNRRQVLLKTAHGPRLVDDPWRNPAPEGVQR